MAEVFQYLNLYDFFVETLFGGFWFSVIGLCIIFLIILWLFGDKVSIATSVNFLLLFVFTMAVGYGVMWITILILLLFLINYLTRYKFIIGGGFN